MDYADEIRRRAEDAPRVALPAIASAMWRAFGEGHLTEAEAEALAGLIEARKVSANSGVNLPISQVIVGPQSENDGADGISNVGNTHIHGSPDPAPSLPENPISLSAGLPRFGDTPQGRQNSPRTGVGARPRTDASLERRRRWAASGRLPSALAARFTPAEQAVLSLVAAETARKGDCRLAIEHMAAVAGVSRSTVKAAIREARKLGLLTVEERRVSAFRNDTNVVRIVSPEWAAWLRLGRKGVADRDTLGRSKGVASHLPLRMGGGVKFSTSTPTQISKQGKTRTGGVPEGRFARPVRAS